MKLTNMPLSLLAVGGLICLLRWDLVKAQVGQQHQQSYFRRKLQNQTLEAVPQGSKELEPSVRFQKENDTNEIIGGVPSGAPYSYFGYWSRGCGASLVAWDILLTASHCTANMGSALGSVYFNSVNLEGGTRIAVSNVIKHPRYDPSTESYDFALLKIARAAPTGSRPIAINHNAANPTPGTNLKVMGFGMVDVDIVERSPTLQEVTVIAEERSCRGAYGEKFNPDIMFCAGSPSGGKDACQVCEFNIGRAAQEKGQYISMLTSISPSLVSIG